MFSINKILVVGTSDQASKIYDFLNSHTKLRVARGYFPMPAHDLSNFCAEELSGIVSVHHILLKEYDWIVLVPVRDHQDLTEMASMLMKIDEEQRPFLTVEAHDSSLIEGIDFSSEAVGIVNFFGALRERNKRILMEISPLTETCSARLVEFRDAVDKKLLARTICARKQLMHLPTYRASMVWALIPLHRVFQRGYQDVSISAAHAIMMRLFGASPFHHYDTLSKGFLESVPGEFLCYANYMIEPMEKYESSSVNQLITRLHGHFIVGYNPKTGETIGVTGSGAEQNWYDSRPSRTPFKDVEENFPDYSVKLYLDYAQRTYHKFMLYVLNLVQDYGREYKIYPPAIDHVFEYGFGFPMGPCRLLQYRGLEAFFKMCERYGYSEVPKWMEVYRLQKRSFYDNVLEPKICFFPEDDKLRKKELRDPLKKFEA